MSKATSVASLDASALPSRVLPARAGRPDDHLERGLSSSVRRRGFSATCLGVIVGPPLVLLAATAATSIGTGIEPSFFVRDPSSTLGGHPLTGVLSHLGVLMWSATASVCMFAHASLRRRTIDAAASAFLLWFALLTTVLALDDLFRFHEDLARRYLGLQQRYVFAAYGLVFVWGFIRFRDVIARTEYALLVLAAMFLGISVFVDVLADVVFPLHFERGWLLRWGIFLEDGFKLLGIVCWGAYFIRMAFLTVAASLSGHGRNPRKEDEDELPEPPVPVAVKDASRGSVS